MRVKNYQLRNTFAACAFSTLLVAALLGGCGSGDDSDTDNTGSAPITAPPVGVPLSGQLDRSRLTLTSALSVDLTTGIARLPLFRGTHNGTTVWFVRTDVSDETLARELGLNFAPRLAGASDGCPSCVQTVRSADPVPGRAPVEFAGTVDFNPSRLITPGPTGFPPLSAQPGSVAQTGYSDLIRVEGSNVVYNAPIVAVGDGPFDTTAFTNVHNRVMAIDTQNGTVDLQFIRAFSHGRDIFYLSFGSSGALSATLERGTFVPVLGSLPFAGDDQNLHSARSAIFTFTNGPRGENSPPAQGLTHVLLDNPPGDLSLQNTALLESLHLGGDAHNVLGSFPLTISDESQRRLYTPMWDLHIAEWDPALAARGEAFAVRDANQIRQLAAQGRVTNPGGAPLGTSNNVVNCPVLGFAAEPPTEDQAPRPQAGSARPLPNR